MTARVVKEKRSAADPAVQGMTQFVPLGFGPAQLLFQDGAFVIREVEQFVLQLFDLFLAAVKLLSQHSDRHDLGLV
jgi:hypothetical protein